MTVNEWFINNGTHQDGINILAQLKYPIRRLINLQKPTESNKEKLRYELKKHKTKTTHQDKIFYNSLPRPLRDKFREQKNLFYEKCELKRDLNRLPKASKDKALEIQIQIFEMDKRIDQIWTEIDYWTNNKILIETPEGFNVDELSIKKLYAERQRLQTSISRRKQTLKKWESELSGIEDKSKHSRKELMISKKHKELLGIQEQLRLINERIKN